MRAWRVGFLGLALSASLAACQSGALAPNATSQPATPVTREALHVTRAAPAATGRAASLPSGMRRPTPSAVISATERVVALPPGTDARPGAWSPSGRYLMAYVIRRSGAMGPVGHLITIDAQTATAIWDSGDMETPLGSPMVAGWLADDSLLLARQDGGLVQADGTRLEPAPWLDDQPEALAVSPDGQRAFVDAAQSAWLMDEQRNMRRVEAWDGPLAAWTWREDGLAVAAVANDGRPILVDVPKAAARELLVRASGAPWGEVTAPAWLADGRILITDARRLVVDGRPMAAHLVVEPATGEVRTLHSVLGWAAERTRPVSLHGRVSPNGRYVLIPLAPVGEASVTQDVLFDVQTRTATLTEGLVEPVWAPTSDRVAFLADGRLAVWPLGATEALLLTTWDGVEHYGWSADGRWIAVGGQGGSLWLVASDGSTAPHQLAPQATWLPPPTWSPAGDELAVAVVTQVAAEAEPAPALVLVRVAAVPPADDETPARDRAPAPP